MRTLILIAILIQSCGTEEPSDTQTIEVVESEPMTVVLCQQAQACDVNDQCMDIEREIEFEVNRDLLYWQACLGFRDCNTGSTVLYSDTQVESFKCGA